MENYELVSEIYIFDVPNDLIEIHNLYDSQCVRCKLTIDCITGILHIENESSIFNYNTFIIHNKFKMLDDQLKIISTHKSKRHWLFAKYKSHYDEIHHLLHTLTLTENN